MIEIKKEFVINGKDERYNLSKYYEQNSLNNSDKSNNDKPLND